MEQPTTRWWLYCTYEDESLDFIKLWNFFIRKEYTASSKKALYHGV
jgi:hypothetical protein